MRSWGKTKTIADSCLSSLCVELLQLVVHDWTIATEQLNDSFYSFTFSFITSSCPCAAVFSSENKHAPAQLVESVLTWLTASRFRPSHLTPFKYLYLILSTYARPSDPAPLSYRMKNRHSVQMKMRRIPNNQHCMMKKGMGSMMVLGSYLSTIRNSVTVIAATSHACWPNFLWNFLMGTFQKVLLWKTPGTGRMLSIICCYQIQGAYKILALQWSLDDLSCWSLWQLTSLLWTWWPTSSQPDLSTLQRASCAVTQSFKCPQ